jgi:hypothetical protein
MASASCQLAGDRPDLRRHRRRGRALRASLRAALAADDLVDRQETAGGEPFNGFIVPPHMSPAVNLGAPPL